TRSKRDWSSDVCSSDLDPTLDSDLERASAGGARSAILLSDDSHGPVDPVTADARTVLTALAVEGANANVYTVAAVRVPTNRRHRSEEHTSELQSRFEVG